jgi:hypothetical protein
LTHISLSYNQITSLQEFTHVRFKEKIVAISIKGNPLARHPNLTVLLIDIFPRLVEIDGARIDVHLKQDMIDGEELSRHLIKYLINNELEIMHADATVKRGRLKLDLVQSSCKEYTIDEINELCELQSIQRSKLRSIPKLTSAGTNKRIRPGFILNAME